MRMVAGDTLKPPYYNPKNWSTYVHCCVCGHLGLLSNMYADLDGEPFKAYYHMGCNGCFPRPLPKNTIT